MGIGKSRVSMNLLRKSMIKNFIGLIDIEQANLILQKSSIEKVIVPRKLIREKEKLTEICKYYKKTYNFELKQLVNNNLKKLTLMLISETKITGKSVIKFKFIAKHFLVGNFLKKETQHRLRSGK
jgi:hypothetical protein